MTIEEPGNGYDIRWSDVGERCWIAILTDLHALTVPPRPDALLLTHRASAEQRLSVLGSDFVIEVDGTFLGSTGSASFPASAAAVRALIGTEAAGRRRMRDAFAAGTRYDANAGDTSFQTWLSGHPPDQSPTK